MEGIDQYYPQVRNMQERVLTCQIHFLAYPENRTPSDSPEWLDTVNVPYGETVDLIMDCHLLNHEDKEMTARILFE